MHFFRHDHAALARSEASCARKYISEVESITNISYTWRYVSSLVKRLDGSDYEFHLARPNSVRFLQSLLGGDQTNESGLFDSPFSDNLSTFARNPVKSTYFKVSIAAAPVPPVASSGSTMIACPSFGPVVGMLL